jgi:hypothetical protein
MNRSIRLLVAAGVPLIIVVGFALATNRGATPPEHARALLSIYLARTSAEGQSPARVVQTVIASRPTLFRRDLSAYSLGSGLYYGTTDLVNRPTDMPTLTPTPKEMFASTPAATPEGFVMRKGEGISLSGYGIHALRYPPDAAMCVLIERGSKYEVVVLAEHYDPWNADWVLHTSTLPPQELIETLGCALNLPQ